MTKKVFKAGLGLKLNLGPLLKERNISRADFAEMTGLHPKTVQSLVNDKYERWGRETLEAICRVLECEIGELLIWE